MRNTAPLVSICCITYNHAGFIKEALDSFLMQKTSFPTEIIIHDDCSTDGTTGIVREYQSIYPDLLKPIFQTENQWSKGKKIFPITFKKAQGKYIALCEGDDYWIDPNKLQKQVDFFEKHPECSMCAHNTRIIDTEDASQEQLFWSTKQNLFLDLGDILEDYLFHTSSVLMKSDVISEIPDWYYKFPGGDWPLYILAAQKGNIGIINEVMSVYRLHPGGIWTSRSLFKKSLAAIQHYQLLILNLSKKYHSILYKTLSTRIFFTGQWYLEQEIKKDTPINEIVRNSRYMRKQLLSEGVFSILQRTKLERKFDSGLYGALGYHFYQKKNIKKAAYYLTLACCFNPARLSDRGYYSVLCELLVGEKAANKIRLRI